MEEWGNARANEYYESNLPPNYPKPKDGDPVRVVEKYIRDKYEHRRFLAAMKPPKKVMRRSRCWCDWHNYFVLQFTTHHPPQYPHPVTRTGASGGSGRGGGGV